MDIKIILSKDLSFDITCKGEHLSDIITKVVMNFYQGEEVICTYHSHDEPDTEYDFSTLKECIFDSGKFYGNFNGITIYNAKNLTESDMIELTK